MFEKGIVDAAKVTRSASRTRLDRQDGSHDRDPHHGHSGEEGICGGGHNHAAAHGLLATQRDSFKSPGRVARALFYRVRQTLTQYLLG